MKRNRYILLTILLIVLIIAAAVGYEQLSKSNEPIDISSSSESNRQPAKDFSVYDTNGTKVTLSQNFGKPIIINFWATWCGPCKTELPYFNELYQKYGNDVNFMMVCTDDGATASDGVKQFLSSGGYTFPVYFDTDLQGSMVYGVYAIPRTIFIDKTGNIAFDHTGYMAKDELELYIQAIMGGGAQ